MTSALANPLRTDVGAPAASQTVVFCGGASGGHLTPGLSTAVALTAARPGTRVVFLVTGRTAERRFTDDAPFERQQVRAVRFPRRVGEVPAFPIRLVQAQRDGRRWIRALSPAAAIGLGGYGQYGPIRAAQRAGIPTVLLEQNAKPGKANRLSARRAAAVCVQWPCSGSHFRKGTNVVVTGNPIRRTVMDGSRESACERFGLDPDRPTLLVLGGSQGSRRLNQAMAAAVAAGPGVADAWQIIHQTGPTEQEAVRASYGALPWRHVVTPFLGPCEMADALAAADLAITRAGATTMAELTATGTPAVLFPLPTADRHQEANAAVMTAAGAARLVTDSGDARKSGADLMKIVRDLCENRDRLCEMAQGSRHLGVRNAAQSVVDVIVHHADVPAAGARR